MVGGSGCFRARWRTCSCGRRGAAGHGWISSGHGSGQLPSRLPIPSREGEQTVGRFHQRLGAAGCKVDLAALTADQGADARYRNAHAFTLEFLRDHPGPYGTAALRTRGPCLSSHQPKQLSWNRRCTPMHADGRREALDRKLNSDVGFCAAPAKHSVLICLCVHLRASAVPVVVFRLSGLAFGQMVTRTCRPGRTRGRRQAHVGSIGARGRASAHTSRGTRGG